MTILDRSPVRKDGFIPPFRSSGQGGRGVRGASRILAAAVGLLSLAAGSAEARPRVLFLGVTRSAPGNVDAAVPAIEAEVARRLSDIGLDVIRANPSPDGSICESEPCLSQKAQDLGVEHVVAGSLVRGASACAASLLLYSAPATPRLTRTEIKCHRDATDESLAPEFADQAGQLGERIAKSAAPKQPVCVPCPTCSCMEQATGRWTQRRKITVSLFGIALAGSTIATIVLGAMESKPAIPGFVWDTGKIAAGFPVAMAISTGGLILTLTERQLKGK